jgi:hypothetical protein
MVVQKALTEFFRALKASPTGNLAGQARWAATFEQYTDLVGLPAYRALEEQYLPAVALAAKYGQAKEPVGA